MLYLTNGPEKASSLKADERVWLIDRLRRERPVREAHGKHTLWEALAHPRDQASTKGPPSAGGDQRGARPATTACGVPFRAIGSRAKRTAPGWGRTGRLLVRSAWGKSDAVGEKGPLSERTVVLAASEATLAGKEPSKVGSETTQIHRWRSALAETLLGLGGSVR